jgi:hypothetical protein
MKNEWWISLLVIVVVFILVGLLYHCCNLNYKKGQIDAALGKQHYHLVKQADSTTHWEKKKQPDQSYDYKIIDSVKYKEATTDHLLPSTRKEQKK